jgi:hypothetical protein
MARKKATTTDNATSDSQIETTKKTDKQNRGKAPTAQTPRKPLARRARTSSNPQADAQAQLTDTSSDANSGIPWRRVDLHIHTPGSHDYEEPDKTYLDILRQAERRGLSMIAFTDHNTVNGYRNMMNEIEHLEYLEKLDRIRPDELGRLNEYRRLLKKIVVLPGFEFTATFGFHILGLFPPEKSLRDIERVLMDLRVPGHVLDKGLTEAGATSDVLAAYEAIDEAGGLAIAAHANSSNGVSMRGMNLGGQTRIAFTQDPHLRAIEFTDLEKGRYSSAHLFTGVKSEYPRRMFAIQGSDAHRLTVSKENAKRLGVGERATEVQLEEVSFNALRDLFLSQDFARVRPAFNILDVKEEVAASARTAGASATVAFHPSLPKRGDRFEAIVRDACAMANGQGGTIFAGCDANPNKKATGVADAADAAQKLAAELVTRIAPPIKVEVKTEREGNADILRVQVLGSADAPHNFDGAHYLIRDGVETRAATRDELVALARRGFEKQRAHAHEPQRHEQRQQHGGQQHKQSQQQQQPRHQQQSHQPRQQQQPQAQNQQKPAEQQRQQQPQQRRQHDQPHNRQAQQQKQKPVNVASTQEPSPAAVEMPVTPSETVQESTASNPTATNGQGGHNAQNGKRGDQTAQVQGMPRTGVQVMDMEERNGVVYFTVRDLRNNSTIRNVTMKSARDLWHYAITQFADYPNGPEEIDWRGDRAVLTREMRAGKMRSDLAMRDASGRVTVFYGATDDGLDTQWKDMIAEFEAAHATATAQPEPDAESAVDAPISE